MKVAATGHRPQEFTDDQAMRTCNWLDFLGDWLVARGMDTVISGMAIGVDTWWAWQAGRQDIPLHAYIPFWQQPKAWPVKDRSEWADLVSVASEVQVFGKSEPYDPSNFFKRNDGMIEDCDEMVVVWNGKKSGGTYHCFNNYKLTGKPWYWYNPATNEAWAGAGENGIKLSL